MRQTADAPPSLSLIAALSAVPVGAEDRPSGIKAELFFSPLPMDHHSVTALKADIAAGRFAKPWSGLVADINWTPDCHVTLSATAILWMLPNDLTLSAKDRALMTAALSALEAHERQHFALWHHIASEIQTANCPANALDIETEGEREIARRNARSNFGFHAGMALLRAD